MSSDNTTTRQAIKMSRISPTTSDQQKKEMSDLTFTKGHFDEEEVEAFLTKIRKHLNNKRDKLNLGA